MWYSIFDGKNYHSEKRQGLVGDHFTDSETLKKLPGSFAIGHNRYSTKTSLEIYSLFLPTYIWEDLALLIMVI